MMLEYLKTLLQKRFEVELLRKSKLELVDIRYETDTPIVGEDIIEWMCYMSNDEYTDRNILEDIHGMAYLASKHLLINGLAKNVYKIYFNDDPDDDGQDFPIYYCTDIRLIGDAIANVNLYGVDDIEDSYERPITNEFLHVTLYYYEDNKINYKDLY